MKVQVDTHESMNAFRINTNLKTDLKPTGILLNSIPAVTTNRLVLDNQDQLDWTPDDI